MHTFLMILSLTLGCSGVTVTDGVVSSDDGEDEEAKEETHWCCEYEGPMGTTHALIDTPKECEEKFGEKQGKFVSGEMCEPVCCKAPNEPEDLEKGYTSEIASKSTCEHKKGEALAIDAEECEEKPKPKPKPKPKTTGTKTRGPMTAPTKN